MDANIPINFEEQLHVPTINYDYGRHFGEVYIAKDAEDAKKYVSEHGGLIFHDIGLERLVVLPNSMAGFVGQINLPMEED